MWNSTNNCWLMAGVGQPFLQKARDYVFFASHKSSLCVIFFSLYFTTLHFILQFESHSYLGGHVKVGLAPGLRFANPCLI